MHFSGSISLVTLALLVCVENGLAIPLQLEERGSSSKSSLNKVASGRVTKPASGGVTASDLKSSNYRKTALEGNQAGSYVKQPDGKSVAWDSKGKGDAEHVIEPGAHVKPVLNQMGIGKKDPLFKDVKSALNHKDNLSMLDNASNIGKAKLAANPSSNPKNGAAAKDYMSKPDVQDKASKTMDKLTAAGNKHGQPSFGSDVKKLVNKNFPNARSFDDDVFELDARDLEFFDLDELD